MVIGQGIAAFTYWIGRDTPAFEMDSAVRQKVLQLSTNTNWN